MYILISFFKKQYIGEGIMYKRIVLILMTFMLVVMFGCAKSERGKQSTAMPAAEGADYSTVTENKSEFTSDDQSGTPMNKKIIQNYEVNIIAEDVRVASQNIGKKAQSLGGYTESEEIMEYSCNASIRIPSEKAEVFVEYLEKTFEVSSKNKSIEDVTDVYIDNDARLKNLRAEESQVLEILKRANTVDEILKVQSELYKIREEIEVLESRKKNWDRQIDYSTIKLYISKKQIVNDKKVKILSSNEFFSSMWKGFINTTTALVLSLQTIVIFLFSNLIPIGILAGLAYTGYKIYKKRRK